LLIDPKPLPQRRGTQKQSPQLVLLKRAVFSVFASVTAVVEFFGATRVAAMACAALLTVSCRQDMHDQPKYEPLEGSTFFADQQASRMPVAGTVARGQLRDDPLLYTGKVDGADAQVFPFNIDEPVMARGRERFDIYCSPCHGRTGQGDGIVVRRGYRRPPPLADERLRQAPVGHYFDVITNGFGAMPDYAAQIAPADRWAIAAYVRALQLSAHATIADVPAAERPQLEARP
jgi:mono/diheme cytochrome c family protein